MDRWRPPKVEKTGLDRLIERVAPTWGMKRYRSRFMAATLGTFTGASKSRRSLQNWTTSSGSPDSDLTHDLATLRDRSRDLDRNNPLAHGALLTKSINVVGQGLKLQARIDREALGLSEEEGQAWESKTEREWRLFWESPEVDLARTSTGHEITRLVYKQTLLNGDVFVAFPRTMGRNPFVYPYSLRLQLIEGDRVCNENYATDSLTLSMGVEKTEAGAPVAYHVMDQHPGDTRYASKRTWTKIPAFGSKTGIRNVLHIFHVDRPGQSRGIPDLSPVIESLKQLARYSEAELMAAVVGAMFTVFIKTATGDAEINPMVPTSSVGGSTTDEDYKLGNGAIVGLAPGEEIQAADPKRPNQAFDPFVQAILRQIGAAIGLPFEVLVKHFTASYSAARAALLDAWKYFLVERTWLASAFCQPVYEIWLYEAISLGRIAAPGYLKDPLIRKAYSGAKWVGDAMGQIDPMKEIDAAEKRLNLALSTMDEETVSLTGGDFEENFPRILKERQMMKEAGLWQPVGTSSPPSPSSSTTEPTPPAKPEDQGDLEGE